MEWDELLPFILLVIPAIFIKWIMPSLFEELSREEKEKRINDLLGTVDPKFVEIKKDTQKEWSRQNGISEISQSTCLTKKQKYAIVGLMAYVQGASPLSIYDDDANEIVQALFVSLGLSKQEIETFLKQSMQRDGEEEANSIIDTLHTIGDKEYLRTLYRKALTVARISESKETIESVRNIFGELNI